VPVAFRWVAVAGTVSGMEADAIPGALEVPAGPAGPPQHYLALVPLRLQHTIALLTHDGQGNFDPVARLSERQLRDFGAACEATADWLREHTRH